MIHRKLAVPHGVFVAWCCLFSLWCPGLARARAYVIRVSMEDGTPVDPGLSATLRELVARVGGTMTESPSVPDQAFLAIGLVASASGMEITVTGPAAPPVSRHVDAAASPELFRETVAHVVLSIVEPRVEADRAAEAQEALAREVRSRALRRAPVPALLHLRLSAYAGPTWLTHDRVAPRVGAALGVVSDRPFQPSIILDAAASTRRGENRASIRDRLNLVSLRTRLSLALLHTTRFALETALPIGIDVIWRQLLAAPPGSRGSEMAARIHPIMGGATSGRLRVWRDAALVITVGADCDLTTRHRDRGEAHTGLARVRPYFTVGFDWTAPRKQPSGSP